MKTLTWDEFRSGKAVMPIAAAIGVFDGLHIGHRELIRRVQGRTGLSSAVITFQENPKRILSPESFRGELSTLEQKLSLVASMGVDLCVLIDFSGDFSKLPGRQFLSMLRESGDIRCLAVGSDFRCGFRLDTDAQDIREFCGERSIGVELLSAVRWAGHPVSSSRIRKAILSGHLEDAALMLGRPYELDLRGARLSDSGRIAVMGGQTSPPPGLYEFSVFRGLEESLGTSGGIAELDPDGTWSLSPEVLSRTRDSFPVALRLFRKVSRE
jgi:FAD synthase